MLEMPKNLKQAIGALSNQFFYLKNANNADFAFLFAQLGLFMLFPVVNLILGLVILFQYEELCAAVIEKMEEKFHLNQQEE